MIPSTRRIPGRHGPALATAGAALLLLGACSSHSHRVGLGPVDNHVLAERTQVYMLFGLVRLNNVDTSRITTDLTSYEIETSYSFWDILLSPILLPLTVTTRSVTVIR